MRSLRIPHIRLAASRRDGFQRRRFHASRVRQNGNDIFDVVVVGGGPAGLSLTTALRSSSVTSHLRVAVVEGMDLDVSRGWRGNGGSWSNRVSSLTPASMGFLTDIGAWKHVDRTRVQSYTAMKVWDGVSGTKIDFSWDTPASPRSKSESESGIIAYMTENINLTHGLLSRLDELGGVEILDKTRVEGITLGEDDGVLDLSSWPVVQLSGAGGRRLTARLLVGADGANSPVRGFMDVQSRGWDYGRMGVVATLRLEEAGMGVGDGFESPGDGGGGRIAYQRFLPSGPVAMLPLPGNYASLVWSTTPTLASLLKSLPTSTLPSLINAAFRLPHIDLKYYDTHGSTLDAEALADDIAWRENSTPPSPDTPLPPRVVGVQDGTVGLFPLKLRHADTYIDERVALVGDAAHTIHPLAGQGLNQGLLDTQSLTKHLEHSLSHGQDIGSVLSLEGYVSDRYIANHVLLGVVDKLNKLYATDFAPVVAVRSVGLGVVDRVAPLKEFFMRRAAGV